MKSLLSTPVQRGNNGPDQTKTLKEWESAEVQATVEGLTAFHKRQMKRIEDAKRLASVTPIQRKTKEK